MFALHNHHTGQTEPVTPARPGTLRVQVGVSIDPAGIPRPGLSTLRACLVADLLRRIGEHQHLQVTTWRDFDEALDTACAALNIHPAETTVPPPPSRDVLITAAADAGRATVTVTVPGSHQQRHWLRPEAVDVDPAAGPSRAALLDDMVAADLDPLAFRLALLDRHYREPVTLTWDDLTTSDKVLRQWRAQAADGAHSPSKPMGARYIAAFHEALDSDLDTPAALATVRALASDTSLPPGARFEMLAYLDRFLGLDLAREVGRPIPAR